MKATEKNSTTRQRMGSPTLCKYMVSGEISHKFCFRHGRCQGCRTEEIARAREDR